MYRCDMEGGEVPWSSEGAQPCAQIHPVRGIVRTYLADGMV